MVRALVLVVVLSGCEEHRPVAAAAAPVAAVPVAPVASDASVVDACVASAYPAPTDAELHDRQRSQHGWFHGGDRERAIEAACDLPDRVVMLEATKPATLWIYQRGDGSAKSYRIDWQSASHGHQTSTTSQAPSGNQFLDVILEGPALHVMAAIGESAATTACRFAGGGAAIADPLIACSTRHGFAKIDALPDKPCSGHADGIGWPLELTWWTGTGSKTLEGNLDTIEPDRSGFTYRFGTGKDTTELTLRPGDHTGSVWFADGHREDCAMIFTDVRR